MSESAVRPGLTIAFEMRYNEDGAASVRWMQNRQPNDIELQIFLAQLSVRQFRVAAMIAQMEEAAAAQAPQGPQLVTAGQNGG